MQLSEPVPDVAAQCGGGRAFGAKEPDSEESRAGSAFAFWTAGVSDGAHKVVSFLTGERDRQFKRGPHLERRVAMEQRTATADIDDLGLVATHVHLVFDLHGECCRHAAGIAVYRSLPLLTGRLMSRGLVVIWI